MMGGKVGQNLCSKISEVRELQRIAIMNVYVSNNRVTKYVKQKT